MTSPSDRPSLQNLQYTTNSPRTARLLARSCPECSRGARALPKVAPKAAVEAITRGVVAEEGRFGVRANSVAVGMIADGMFHQLMASGDFDEKVLDAMRRNLALGRLGSAQEVADAVHFLASDNAAYITGQVLAVDGGFAL